MISTPFASTYQPHKVKLILNPMADMGRAWKTANELRPIAQEFKGELTWSGTVYPTHAIELAKQAVQEGCDMVIALGGDGTVHEVINGLMQVPENKRPVMGIVPIGSGNDFAYSMGITQKSSHALAHALKAENIQPVDIGLMTDEQGRKDILLTGGGIIPRSDIEALQQQGIGRLFGPGTPTSDLVDYIKSWTAEHLDH